MTNMEMLHDKAELEAFLRQNTFLQIYSIGDLDDFFWPYTSWYGLRIQDQLQAVILLYIGIPQPVLLAISDEAEREPLADLVRGSMHLLPRQFYSHLSPNLESIICEQYDLAPYGRYFKMALTMPDKLRTINTTNTVRLSPVHLTEIEALYAASYVDNAFDPRMLETGQYFGIWDGEKLVSIAGIHVYSSIYRVAGLGNVATHVDYRSRGLAKRVTAKLSQSLLETVDHIGLNVKADNIAAITAYEALGFEVIGEYGEFTCEAKK